MSGVTNQYEIAPRLKVNQALVNKDLKWILEQSRNELYKDAPNKIQKMQALHLAKDTAMQQFELSANSTILDDAMSFVASHSQTIDNVRKSLDERAEKAKQEIATDNQMQQQEQQK